MVNGAVGSSGAPPSLSISIPMTSGATDAVRPAMSRAVKSASAKVVTFEEPNDDVDESDHSSICQSPSWEGYGQKRRRKRQEAEKQKRDRILADKEAKLAKKKLSSKLSKTTPPSKRPVHPLVLASRTLSTPQLELWDSDMEASRPKTSPERPANDRRHTIVPRPSTANLNEEFKVLRDRPTSDGGFLGGIKYHQEREEAARRSSFAPEPHPAVRPPPARGALVENRTEKAKSIASTAPFLPPIPPIMAPVSSVDGQRPSSSGSITQPAPRWMGSDHYSRSQSITNASTPNLTQQQETERSYWRREQKPREMPTSYRAPRSVDVLVAAKQNEPERGRSTTTGSGSSYVNHHRQKSIERAMSGFVDEQLVFQSAARAQPEPQQTRSNSIAAESSSSRMQSAPPASRRPNSFSPQTSPTLDGASYMSFLNKPYHPLDLSLKTPADLSVQTPTVKHQDPEKIRSPLSASFGGLKDAAKAALNRTSVYHAQPPAAQPTTQPDLPKMPASIKQDQKPQQARPADARQAEAKPLETYRAAARRPDGSQHDSRQQAQYPPRPRTPKESDEPKFDMLAPPPRSPRRPSMEQIVPKALTVRREAERSSSSSYEYDALPSPLTTPDTSQPQSRKNSQTLLNDSSKTMDSGKDASKAQQQQNPSSQASSPQSSAKDTVFDESDNNNSNNNWRSSGEQGDLDIESVTTSSAAGGSKSSLVYELPGDSVPDRAKMEASKREADEWRMKQEAEDRFRKQRIQSLGDLAPSDSSPEVANFSLPTPPRRSAARRPSFSTTMLAGAGLSSAPAKTPSTQNSGGRVDEDTTVPNTNRASSAATQPIVRKPVPSESYSNSNVNARRDSSTGATAPTASKTQTTPHTATLAPTPAVSYGRPRAASSSIVTPSKQSQGTTGSGGNKSNSSSNNTSSMSTTQHQRNSVGAEASTNDTSRKSSFPGSGHSSSNSAGSRAAFLPGPHQSLGLHQQQNQQQQQQQRPPPPTGTITTPQVTIPPPSTKSSASTSRVTGTHRASTSFSMPAVVPSGRMSPAAKATTASGSMSTAPTGTSATPSKRPVSLPTPTTTSTALVAPPPPPIPPTTALEAPRKVAKMFVECCSCRFFHDLPSRVYACMAQPDAVVEDRALGVSGAITTMVKCPWCSHGMTTKCCKGYAAVVWLKERLH